MHTLLINLFAGTFRSPEWVPYRDAKTNKPREFKTSQDADGVGREWASVSGYSYGDYRVESDFEVGDGCSWTIATDRVAGTVVEVSPSGHKVVMQRDAARMVSCSMFSESQTYEFEPDPNGPRYTFTRRKLSNGRSIYKMTGSRSNSQGMYLTHGRREYRDPCF